MYKILVKIKIAVGHRGDNSDQQSFSQNGQGVLKSPETGVYLRFIALPLPAGMQGLQGW